MHVQTLQMDPRIAAIHYKDYRKKVREHRTKRLEAAEKKIQEGGKMFRAGRHERSTIEKEDETLMLSYREMARGQRILNLSQVFREFGVDRDNKSRLPVLAVARSNWEHVWLSSQRGSHITFSKTSWPQWTGRSGNSGYDLNTIPFKRSVFPAELWNAEWRKSQNLPEVHRSRALVPAVPVHLRPAGDLSEYFTLFEAKWTHEAPPDPLLLKHVTGHIYSVVAQWDLTDIEKMVLEGRVLT